MDLPLIVFFSTVKCRNVDSWTELGTLVDLFF